MGSPVRLLPLALALPLAALGCMAPEGLPDDRDPSGVERFDIAGPEGRLSFLRAGDPRGQRVVLVHGTPGRATQWAPLLRDVPAGFELVALDRPGFGASDPRGAVPDLERQARALEPLLVDRAAGPTLLAGHSLGGPIVLEAACDFPDRVGGVLLLASNGDPDLEQLQWYNRLARGLAFLLPRAWRNANRELYGHRAELEALGARLPELRCPVVVVQGDEDDLVPPANADYFAHVLTRVTVVPLHGEDHFFIWTQPDVVRAALAQLAGEVRTAAGPREAGPPVSAP